MDNFWSLLEVYKWTRCASKLPPDANYIILLHVLADDLGFNDEESVSIPASWHCAPSNVALSTRCRMLSGSLQGGKKWVEEVVRFLQKY